MKTQPKLIKNLKGWNGVAKLWQVDDKYYVTSYVCGPFESDSEGVVSSYADLGCIRNREAHELLIDELINGL